MPKKIRIIPWLDTRQLKKQLEQLGKEKQKVNVNIEEKGIQNTTKQVEGLSKSVKNTDSIFAKLKGTIANTFSANKLALTGFLLVLREISNAGRDAKQAIKEIDKAVTDLQVATNMSRESVEGLVKGYNEYGKSLASTTTDVTSAADDYLRAGKSLNEAQTLIKDSIMLSKLGQIESGTATEDLLAVMNGYEMSIDEVGKALDAMVALDMEAATSSGDIATALKYCASSADVAGLSFNKLSAMIATTQEKTMQSAETIGTFMNTLLSRYRNVKIGQFVDDDGEDLSEVETILGSLNVKLRDSNQEFRNFETVIEEVASSWNSYSSVQQAAIAKAFSGTRQQNRFYALMEGYSKTLELTEVAANSAGTALDKFNNSYMNSLEAKQNTLQASFESMILNSDMDGIYSGILEATTALVDFINQTNLLKGALTGLTAAGAIKAFLSIRTGINEAYISLNQFQNALNIIKQTTIPTKDFNKLLLLTNSLSASQMKLVLSSQSLTAKQKEQIVVNSTLGEEEKALLIQTYGLATAETGLTAVTTTMGNAFRALWNTLLANPLVLVTTLVSGVVMAWQSYQNHLEELRQATEESANAYKESASSIDDYTKRYQELQQALIAANGNEEETYNIKQQLLDLQTELNDKFGEEYGKINLVTDAYRDQTDAIKSLNKEAAKEFLNTDRKGIEKAEEQMTKERHYNLSPENISVYTDEGKILKEIAEQFKDQGVSLLDELGDGSQFSIHLNADAQSAYDTINEFENAVREKAEELGNEHLFDDVLDMSTDSLNNSKDVLDEWGGIYQQSLLANIAKNDELSSQMNELIQSVQDYNDAVLKSSDPYNDDEVLKAKEKILQLEALMKNDDGSWNAKWQKYGSVVNEVLNQADFRLLDFDNAIKNDTAVQELAEKLRGLDDVSLQSIADSMDDGSKFQGVAEQLLKITESGDEVKEAFSELIEFADEYGVNVDELISELVRLNYIQTSVASSAEQTASAFGGWDALNEQIDAIQTSYKAIQAAQEEYNQYGYVSLDTLQSLISLDSEYLACLIDENGQLQLNSLTYQDLVQAKLAEAEATAVAQAVEELSNLQKQADVQNSAACVNANAVLAESLATLSGNYSAVASSAAAAAKAEAIASAMSDARERGVAEADINKVMSNLNAKLALIQNTTGSVKKSFGGLNNAVNGFSNAQKGAGKATKDTTDALKEQKEALEKQKEALEDSKKELEELYDAIQWFYDKQIDGIDDFIDKLNDANDVLEKQKDKYDNILSVINNVYGDEIDAIQAKIDAMDKANDAAERELALEKAKQALEEARNRRAIKAYTKNRGYVYTVNEDAVKKAEDELANATQDKVKAELQEQIDLLEQWRDKWAEIPDAYEKAVNEIAAIEKFGPDYKNFILSSDDDDINNFKNDYTGVQSNIADNDAKIDYYEQQKKKIEELKDLWEDAKNAYRDSQYEAKLSAFFGSDYEYQLLNNSSSWRIKFADEYADVCRQIEEIEKQIKSLSSETTSSLTSQADQAANALGNTKNAIGGLKDTAEGNGLSYYIWTADDEIALMSAQSRLTEINRILAEGGPEAQKYGSEFENCRGSLETFVGEYEKLRNTRQVTEDTRTATEELNTSLQNLKTSGSDYGTYFDSVITNAGARLEESANYTDHIVEYTKAAAENMNYLNEAIQVSKESNAEIKENTDNAVEDTNALVSTALENVNRLNEGLSSISTAKAELETMVNEEAADADTLVTASEERIAGIQTLITELLNALTQLENAFTQLNFQMSQLDSVTLDNVISSIGFGGEEGSGLCGGISNVVTLLNGEEGLLAQLGILDETPLDTITAEFNGEEGLTVAITDVITMISGEEGLIAQINRITETIANIDSVKASFTGLEQQTSQCVNKVVELSNKINSLHDKTITITTVYKTVGSPAGGAGGKATGTAFTGNGYVSGTVNTGNTYAQGNNWGLPYDQKAMVSELGPELLLRNGKYALIKEPQLMDLKKGDIIFNHEQTKAILERGNSFNTSRLNKLGKEKTAKIQEQYEEYDIFKGNVFGIGTIKPEAWENFKNSILSNNLLSQNVVKNNYTNPNVTKSTSTVIEINGDLSFPNINSGDDARKLISELENLSNTALQRAYRRDFR